MTIRVNLILQGQDFDSCVKKPECEEFAITSVADSDFIRVQNNMVAIYNRLKSVKDWMILTNFGAALFGQNGL